MRDNPYEAPKEGIVADGPHKPKWDWLLSVIVVLVGVLVLVAVTVFVLYPWLR